MVIFKRPERENCLQNSIRSQLDEWQLREYKQLSFDQLLCLDICEECYKMAALPQAGFAACKLRENYRDRDLIVSRMKSGDSRNLNENKKFLEYSPAKYNGKLMNSIWGFYNRYSPHNIKGNDFDSQKSDYYLQQQNFAVASPFIAKELAMNRSGHETNPEK